MLRGYEYTYVTYNQIGIIFDSYPSPSLGMTELKDLATKIQSHLNFLWIRFNTMIVIIVLISWNFVKIQN